MPVAQDHKRIGEGDTGPNTGGMGAYAPAPIADDAGVAHGDVHPAGHRRPRPCRHAVRRRAVRRADPHRRRTATARVELPLRRPRDAGASLPLLETDLAAIALACTRGALDPASVRCAPAPPARSSPPRPATRQPRSRARRSPTRAAASDQALVFHAGVARDGGGRLVTAGGRVLAVTGLGDDLAAARDAAYARLAAIDFDGMQVRRDIGWRAIGATRAHLCVGGRRHRRRQRRGVSC